MKFFIIILAVIGIDNYVGQATAYTVTATVDNVLDFGNNVFRAKHTHTGNEVQFNKAVKEGDLTYFMQLTLDGEAIDSSMENNPRDFCGNTTEAQILRGAVLPKGQTSCPVRMGYYEVPNEYDVDISDTDGTKMKCGEYTARANIRSGKNTVGIVLFNFDLDESQQNCSN